MPATRRPRTSGGPAAKGAQSTLSFGAKGKVTKAVPPIGKSKLSESIKAEAVKPEVEDVVVVEEEKVEKEEEEEEVKQVLVGKPVVEKRVGDEEVALAGLVDEKQIRSYWRKREGERIAGRVHQEDLTVEEKILRLFDMSSQYGPCIGITRMKRWNRANKLGLNPPVEVLAVLLKEEKKGNPKIETAYVDELMGAKMLGGEA